MGKGGGEREGNDMGGERGGLGREGREKGRRVGASLGGERGGALRRRRVALVARCARGQRHGRHNAGRTGGVGGREEGAGDAGQFRPALGEQWASARALLQASMPKGAEQEEHRAECQRWTASLILLC